MQQAITVRVISHLLLYLIFAGITLTYIYRINFSKGSFSKAELSRLLLFTAILGYSAAQINNYLPLLLRLCCS